MPSSAVIGKILIYTIPILINGLKEIIPLVRKTMKRKQDAEKIEQLLNHLSSTMEEVKLFSEKQEQKNRKLRMVIIILAVTQAVSLGLAAAAFIAVNN